MLLLFVQAVFLLCFAWGANKIWTQSKRKKLIKSKGRLVIITGATGGLGREISQIYAKYKCKLVLIGRDEKQLKNLSKECESLGSPSCKTISCDFAQPNFVEYVCGFSLS